MKIADETIIKFRNGKEYICRPKCTKKLELKEKVSWSVVG